MLHQTSEGNLWTVENTIEEVMRLGTSAVKSIGLWLTLEGELKCCAWSKISSWLSYSDKSYFSRCTCIPWRRQSPRIYWCINQYYTLQIHQDQLADYIDVFCETGYFSVYETEQIMETELNLA
jgi:imidazolonepropionase